METIGSWALGVTACLAALPGLPIVALWFWRKSTEHSKGWVAHLLFLPCAVAIGWISIWAIGVAAHDTGDGPPGEGFIYLPSFAGFAVSVALYYIAVGLRIISGVLRLVWRRSRKPRFNP